MVGVGKGDGTRKMSEQWYLSRKGEQYGPYNWAQLREFAEAGRVRPEDFVWCEGMPDWVAAVEVEGLLGPRAPAAPPVHPAGASQPAPSRSTSEQPEERAAADAPREARGADDERIAGIIPAMRRKTGLFSSKVFNLVVTDRRILFAEVTNEMLKDAAKDAAAEAKADGKGFIARAAATAGSWHRVHQQYWQMTPEAILAESSNNTSINHRDIVSIRIRGGGFDYDDSQQAPDEMLIKTNREKVKLFFERGRSGEARSLLRELLGKRVR